MLQPLPNKATRKRSFCNKYYDIHSITIWWEWKRVLNKKKSIFHEICAHATRTLIHTQQSLFLFLLTPFSQHLLPRHFGVNLLLQNTAKMIIITKEYKTKQRKIYLHVIGNQYRPIFEKIFVSVKSVAWANYHENNTRKQAIRRWISWWLTSVDSAWDTKWRLSKWQCFRKDGTKEIWMKGMRSDWKVRRKNEHVWCPQSLL